MVQQSTFTGRTSLMSIAGITVAAVAIVAFLLPSDNTSDIPTHAFLVDGAEDLGWPTIRGPHFDGHSAEVHLADRWPDEGPPVLWRRDLGQGYSSLTAAHGRVFTQYQTLAGQFVLCLDAASGSTIWQHRYDDAYDLTGMYPGPRSTPTINGKLIYFTSPDVVAGCIDWDGNTVWTIDLKSRFGSRGTGFGYACSPIIADGKVLLPVGGQNACMIALDSLTGEVVWKSGDHSASYTPALPITVNGQQLVIGYLQHTLCGFDLRSGMQLFSMNLSRGYDEHAAWPIASGDLLWVASPFQGGSQLYRIRPAESPPIELLGEWESMSNDVASSVLVDGYVYGFDLTEAQSKSSRPSRGSFRCVDLRTGKIAWSNGDPKQRRGFDYESSADSQTIGHASVIVADKKLIMLNDTGDLILAKASPDRYTELARARILSDGIGWATPSLHSGRLYARNQTSAVCVHLGERERIDAKVLQQSRNPSDLAPSDAGMNGFGVSPQDRLQAPTARWLGACWLATAASILCAALIATIIDWVSSPRLRSMWRVWFWISGIISCALCGPLLSRAVGHWVFTWPGCLFLAFHATFFTAKLRRHQPGSSALIGRAAAFGFLAMCGVYFFVCRSQGLVTQWVFLCAFIAAIPTLLICRLLRGRKGLVNRLYEIVAFVASLAAYYLGAAAILWWHYGLN